MTPRAAGEPQEDRRTGQRVSLAIVQHAHQYLITDGYDNREGITQILDAFTPVFALHLKYRVPLNLHASAMLLEAIAWHRPVFFEWIAALRAEGLLEVIGSAYSQNIMPLFGDAHNARQLREGLDAYRRFLDVNPLSVHGFWVPERVWDTARVAPLLRDPTLPNGGYRYVLLDDRLAYRDHGQQGSARRRFDSGTPPLGGDAPVRAAGDAMRDRHLEAYRIHGSGDLIAFPISVDLRYSVPPKEGEQWRRIRKALRDTARAGDDAIAVFADDLERSAAVGPWASGRWHRASVSPYERFLRWISVEERLHAVLLGEWLAEHPPKRERAVDPGTYFELAHQMRAGERYDLWWEGPAWRPYRTLLAEAEAAVRDAPPDAAAGGLWELAWKQLLACSFETAWHDVAPDGTPRPAPWARACAAHARSVHVIAAAAEWERARDGAAHAERIDIDRDGDDELVLRNDHLFAVVSPAYGGRLVYLFDLTVPGGRLVVGNPADDWNWQEELNQFMLVPRNHPGAFADVGHENDRHRVRRFGVQADGGIAEGVLQNAEGGSAMFGAAKVFRVSPFARSIEVEYRLPRVPERHRVELCLSPDYLRLLRHGRRGLARITRARGRGWRNGSSAAWVQLPRGEPVLWDVPVQRECGHGSMLAVASYGATFRLRIGVGLGRAGRNR